MGNYLFLVFNSSIQKAYFPSLTNIFGNMFYITTVTVAAVSVCAAEGTSVAQYFVVVVVVDKVSLGVASLPLVFIALLRTLLDMIRKVELVHVQTNNVFAQHLLV